AIAGAAALLAELPPERWAVVTSAGHELARTRLATVGLPVPRVLVGADDVARGKPAPDGYLRAADALGVPPARCVVLEDTPVGAEAGRAAGAIVIGLRTTFPAVDGCDFLVADLRAVRAAPSGRGSTAIRLFLTLASN
nr:HAD-IA family hydrolase [Acidobacteriota bacterium]